MSKKGKEAGMHDDIQVDISLKAFINDQIEALQTALEVPVQEDLECTDREHRGVERAVKTINAALAADRNRRLLDKTAIQAVIEQIEYLRECERGKAKIVRLDENDRLFVDRDDWLDDLPPAWPVETEMDNGHEVEIDKTKLDEYEKLYQAVQALRQKKHILQQKTEHYAMTEDLLRRRLVKD